MKKLLSLAALLLACIPGAYAQNNGANLPGHPDARNDRQIKSQDRSNMHGQKHAVAKSMQHKRHPRIVKSHQPHRAT